MATPRSGDLYDLACKPCQLDGQLQEAVGLCTDCQDYLCQNCFDIHTLPIPSRNHELLTNEQMLQSQTALKGKDKCSEKCTVHEDEVIKFYCINHCRLGCGVCIALDHRTCESVRYIPKEASDLANNEEFTLTETHLKSVVERYKKITSEDYRQKTEALEIDCSEAIKTIHQFRKELNETLDKIETDLIRACEAVKSEESYQLAKMVNTLKAKQKELLTLSALTETYRRNKQNCSLYTIMMTIKDKLKFAEEKMKEAEKKLSYTNSQISFVANKDTLHSLKQTDALGKVTRTEDEDAEFLAHALNTLGSVSDEETIFEPETILEKKGNSHVYEVTEHGHSSVNEPVEETNINNTSTANVFGRSQGIAKKMDVKSEEKKMTHQCGEDQYRRLNADGKKRYDRKFLLQLQFVSAAMVKPEGLPNFPDIILDKPRIVDRNAALGCGSEFGNFEFTPKYVWQSSSPGLMFGKSPWIPRRVDNNTNTIDQILKEVEQEAQEKTLQAQQSHIAKQLPLRGDQGGRRGPPGQMGGGSDGWNTLGGSITPLKSVDRSIDLSKIKFSMQNVDESNLQLGPRGGAHRFAGWGSGNTGGTTGRPSQEKEKPNAPVNRFSILNKPDEDSSCRYGVTNPGRGDPKGRGGWGRPPLLNPRQSQEMEREKALSAAKVIGRPSAEGTQMDRSRGRKLDKPDRPATMAPAGQAVKELTADEMEKKTKSILDEFLHIQDLKEAILCVKELSANNHHHFVYNAINHVIERSIVARRQTGHLLHDLVKENVITSQSYLKGLLEVLEFAEDMEIDIPKIWQYYRELISPMIQDGSVPMSFLKQVCQPLLSSNKAGIFLAEVLHDASHKEGHRKVAGFWLASGLQWSDFVPKKKVEQFLKEKDLEFTKGGDSAPTTPTTGLQLQEIADKLHLLIVSQCADNEAVFDWIESNVDEPTTKQPKFIRALMTAVCNSAIKGKKGKERVEPKDINNRNDLLQKYLDHQLESELQALYALQALVTKLEHPPGVLRHMFDTLFDEDIISEDAFIQWEKSADEPDGKRASLKQVLQFFQWLREAEDDS